uniref:Uncharacterized protein n=1 Tax=Arundo donax TaxID=35708 RepID=A0A0A9CAU7_ARUDO
MHSRKNGAVLSSCSLVEKDYFALNHCNMYVCPVLPSNL